MSDEASTPQGDAADESGSPGQRKGRGRGGAHPKGWVSLATGLLDLAEDFDPPSDPGKDEG